MVKLRAATVKVMKPLLSKLGVVEVHDGSKKTPQSMKLTLSGDDKVEGAWAAVPGMGTALGRELAKVLKPYASKAEGFNHGEKTESDIGHADFADLDSDYTIFAIPNGPAFGKEVKFLVKAVRVVPVEGKRAAFIADTLNARSGELDKLLKDVVAEAKSLQKELGATNVAFNNKNPKIFPNVFTNGDGIVVITQFEVVVVRASADNKLPDGSSASRAFEDVVRRLAKKFNAAFDDAY